jgi:hypothetical protein
MLTRRRKPRGCRRRWAGWADFRPLYGTGMGVRYESCQHMGSGPVLTPHAQGREPDCDA